MSDYSILACQPEFKIKSQSTLKQSNNNNGSHESEAVMQLKQVFIWRHINRQWQQQTAVWTQLWWKDKAVARGSSAETLLGHFCRRRRDALSPDTGLLWHAVAPQLKCSEDFVYTHHRLLLLMFSWGPAWCRVSLCVGECHRKSQCLYLLSPVRKYNWWL